MLFLIQCRHSSKHFSVTSTCQQKLYLKLSFWTPSFLLKYFETLKTILCIHLPPMKFRNEMTHLIFMRRGYYTQLIAKCNTICFQACNLLSSQMCYHYWFAFHKRFSSTLQKDYLLKTWKILSVFGSFDH